MEKFLNAIFSTLAYCYFLMLLIGAAHHEVDSRIPAIGFSGTVVLVVLSSFVISLLRSEFYSVKGARS